VLSSLSFPPASRFAMQKAHAEAAAAAAAAEKSLELTDEDGRDPNLAYSNPRGEAGSAEMAAPGGVGAAGEAALECKQPDVPAGAEELDAAEFDALPPASSSSPGKGWEGGLVYSRRPDGHHYDLPTATFRFKQLTSRPASSKPQRVPSASPRGRSSSQPAKPATAGAAAKGPAGTETGPAGATHSQQPSGGAFSVVAEEPYNPGNSAAVEPPQGQTTEAAAAVTVAARAMAAAEAPDAVDALLGACILPSCRDPA
jgi:hypothetical protein